MVARYRRKRRLRRQETIEGIEFTSQYYLPNGSIAIGIIWNRARCALESNLDLFRKTFLAPYILGFLYCDLINIASAFGYKLQYDVYLQLVPFYESKKAVVSFPSLMKSSIRSVWIILITECPRSNTSFIIE